MQIQIQIQIQVSVVAVAGEGGSMMMMMTSSIHPSLSLKIHCDAFITVYVMAQMSKYQKMH
jgi:hypothetical protein